jgi:enoyl-[acyl-carrier protein] reductase II
VLLRTPEDGTVISRAFTGKTCRVVRNDYTQHFDQHPDELKPFPQQAIQSMQDGANHLGATPDTEVDVTREFFPAGQGVGAINELVPAGDLVRQFVREAEEIIERLTKLRG